MVDQFPCGCTFNYGPTGCECSILCGWCWPSFKEEQHGAAIAENEERHSLTDSPTDQMVALVTDALARIKAAERTVVCHPDDEPLIQTLVNGTPGMTVRVNDFCPPGKVFIINENTFGDALAGALRDWSADD